MGPGNGPGTADHWLREHRAERQIISQLYPFILGRAASVTGRWALVFFVVIRCVVQTLCRITIIRRKRISYNMARRGGVWVM